VNSQYTNPTRPDLLRRRLLMALPSGLAVVSPLSLIACGGGGDESGNGDPTVVVPDAPPGPITSAPMSVEVQVPAGMTLPAGTLRVTSAAAEGEVVGATATIIVVGGGPHLCAVLAGDGTPLLLGWAGTGQAPLSARSTALVLLHFALGLPWFGDEVRDALRDRLAAQPAVDALGNWLAQALVNDAQLLRRVPDSLLTAINEAAASLLPFSTPPAASRTRPLAVRVDDSAQRSGVSVQQGESLNSVFIDNVFARRAVCFINREATIGADGVRVPEPQGPTQVGEAITVPVPGAIDSFGSVINGWANEYYSGDTNGTFFRSITDPVTLDISPESARRAEYSVIVMMPGSLPRADDRFARLSAAQRAYLTSPDLNKNLYLQAWLIDLLGPVLMTLLPEKLAERARLSDRAAALAATVLGVLNSNVPDLVQQTAAGRLSPFDAFKRVIAALSVDPNTLAFSPLGVQLLQEVIAWGALQLSDLALRSDMLKTAASLGEAGSRLPLSLMPVLQLLGKIDKLLLGAQTTRVVADMARSRSMEEWAVTATRAKVTLTPNPFEVDPQGTFVPITVGIADNDDDEYGNEKGSIRFVWTCSARYGTLFKRGEGNRETNSFETSNANATCDYQPSGQEPGDQPETIKVTAFFTRNGLGPAEQRIGDATATVQFKKAFSLSMTPVSGTELPIDQTCGLSAQIKENLPAGTTVEWQWSHSGVGRLEPQAANTANPQLSMATLVTGSTEGDALVTARAQVNVPGSTTAPPRSVLTNPLSVRLPVKRGLRTMTFAGSWTTFAEYTGNSVNVVAYVVVPKVSGARSYSVLLEKPTPDVRGGVPFPSTRTLDPANPSSSWSDRGGAWWSGLSSGSSNASGAAGWVTWFQGRFGDMKVTVTVTM
jgi:hypothetical protein